jgi:hypothetical protein
MGEQNQDYQAADFTQYGGPGEPVKDNQMFPLDFFILLIFLFSFLVLLSESCVFIHGINKI